MRKFANRAEEKPKDHDLYLFKTLTRAEKLTIRLVYFRRWRRFLRNSRLSGNQKKYFKLYFYEAHARYYLTVVQGSTYVIATRLIRNFFLSKVNENLRAVLSSLDPYNLTIFVHGLRSQIELNALLNKFLKDPDYHKNHLVLNEDRRRAKELKTTININTLVDGLGSEVLPYPDTYHSLSLLLHPNPSAIKFYAQAERGPTEDGSGIFRAQIKYYFDRTISDTDRTSLWFGNHVWLFLTTIEHFLSLFDQLTNEFYLNEIEEKQHGQFAMSAFMKAHEKQILAAVNKAKRENKDTQEALGEVMQSILENGRGNRPQDNDTECR